MPLFGRKNKVEKALDQEDEVITLFLSLEKLASERPEVFSYLMSKYGTQILDSYDWGALWRQDVEPVGILDRYLPYIVAVLNIIILVVVIRLK